MRIRHVIMLAAVPTWLLALSPTSRGAEPAASASAVPPAPVQGTSVGPELQHEISQVLWGCFAVGADLVGLGDVQGAKSVLHDCFTDDMTFDAVMPPAYAKLDFSTSGGSDGFVNGANQVYRGMNIVRVQHLITNVVIERTGPDTATVNSGALAVHTYQDEHVFNANVKFVDSFQRIGGVWKITHRTMNVISVSQAAAWTP
jgi:hypothetical protein